MLTPLLLLSVTKQHHINDNNDEKLNKQTNESNNQIKITFSVSFLNFRLYLFASNLLILHLIFYLFISIQ